MLLNAKKLAFLGLLLSVDIILIVLSAVLEINTLFLLAAASFCVGIAIREGGKTIGLGFFLGSLILGIILAPNKAYCITYAAMAMYLVIIENAFDLLLRIKSNNTRKTLFWIIKYLVFNLLYFPILILLPKLIYLGNIDIRIFAVLILAGQVALFLYDRGYEYFQGSIWGKIRKKIKLD